MKRFFAMLATLPILLGAAPVAAIADDDVITLGASVQSRAR